MSKKAKNNLLSDRLTYIGNSKTTTHLHLCTYDSNKVQGKEGISFDEISNSFMENGINWLQIHGLENTETIRQICNYFAIDFLVLQDILNINHLTKVEEHEQYTVVILKLFKHKGAEKELLSQQLCLILGQNFVLTFIEDETDFFNDVSSAIEKNVLKIRNRQSDFLLSVLLNSVMANYISIVTNIDDDLENIEDLLLSTTNNDETGVKIQILRQQYLMIKKVIVPLKEQYIKLIRTESSLIHKTNRAYFNDVNDHLQFVIQTMEICRETLASLVDLYISNNDLKMNSIMKQLTIVSTVFIPLTFLVGVWGMNFNSMPELNWQHGYLFAWTLMIIIGGLVFIYIRNRKW